MANGWTGWKTRINSTMKTNSRMNAILSDPMNFMSLSKKKNVYRLKEQFLQETQSNVSNPEQREEPPAIETKPNIEEIYRILKDTIAEQLDEEKFFQTYNSQISYKFCQILSREIRTRIKLINTNRDRYRVICLVTIVEKLQQAMDYKMKYALDPNIDNFSTYTYEGATYYIIATAFIVYKE